MLMKLWLFIFIKVVYGFLPRLSSISTVPFQLYGTHLLCLLFLSNDSLTFCFIIGIEYFNRSSVDLWISREIKIRESNHFF